MIRVLTLLFALCWANLAQAQCNGASLLDDLTDDELQRLTTAALETPYGIGNVWQARRGNVTLTIMGTMHLPDPRHDRFLAIAQPYLEQADLLLVEATLDDQSAMQAHMARNPHILTLNDGTTLPERLDPATWDAVVEAATARGIPGFMAAKMQPWFLTLTLAIPPCAMSAMASGSGGLDNELITRAQSLGVPSAPLEPWEDMLALLMSGTIEEQIDALRVGLVAPGLQDKILVATLDLYFAEQSAMTWELARLSKVFLPPSAAEVFDAQLDLLENELLTKRNANWIPVIEDAATRHDTIFLGFGAAHLFGETGVLNLLDQNGWVITPI